MTKLQFTANGENAALAGDITESSGEALDKLVHWANGRKSGCIDLEGVHAINSTGTRLWLSAIERFDNRGFKLARCSVDFIDVANMVGELVGGLTVESMMAPLVCEHCGRQSEALLDAVARKLPACSTCGQATTLAIDPDDYFRFLK